MNTQTPRYWLQIQFTGQEGKLIRTWDITEPIKTLQECHSYRSTIDHTVSKAQVVDTIKGEVVERWK